MILTPSFPVLQQLMIAKYMSTCILVLFPVHHDAVVSKCPTLGEWQPVTRACDNRF
jgi:hypothetical protein